MVDTGSLWSQMGSVPPEDPQINHPDRHAMLPRQTGPEHPRMIQAVSETERPVRTYNTRHTVSAAEQAPPDKRPPRPSEAAVAHGRQPVSPVVAVAAIVGVAAGLAALFM
jgi:hypothetical protein